MNYSNPADLLDWIEDMIEVFDDYDNAVFEMMDMARGLYWYCADHHSGQASEEYRILSRLSEIYKPSPIESGVEIGGLSEAVSYTHLTLPTIYSV